MTHGSRLLVRPFSTMAASIGLLIVGAASSVDEPARPPSPAMPRRFSCERVIATVLGRSIVESDLDSLIESPSESTEYGRERERQEQLQSLIFSTLRDEYCREHDLEPTPEECAAARKSLLRDFYVDMWSEYIVGVLAGLVLDDLNDAERRQVWLILCVCLDPVGGTTRERLHRLIQAMIDSRDTGEDERDEWRSILDELDAVERWPVALRRGFNFDRALYRRFGGLVMFQQFDPVIPIDAHREWLKEEEARGRFQIFDEEYSAQFWQAYTVSRFDRWAHLPTEDPFAIPWWEQTEEPMLR
jgi:hypothetical protein